MSASDSEILDRMGAIWETEIDGKPGGRDRSLTAAEVRQQVEESGPESVLGPAVIEFLEHMCSVFENDQVPDRRERYLCDCALAMVTEEGGVTAPEPLVQRIVRAFPPALAHFQVGQLIAVYLSFGELVDALLGGIDSPSHPAVVEDCLTGFRLYLGSAEREDREKMSRRARAATEQLAPFIRGGDSETRRLAENAVAALRSFID